MNCKSRKFQLIKRLIPKIIKTLGFKFVVPICSIVEIATYAKYISFEQKIRENENVCNKNQFPYLDTL